MAVAPTYRVSGDANIWGFREIKCGGFEASRREIHTSYWERAHLDKLMCYVKTREYAQTSFQGTVTLPNDFLYSGLRLNGDQIRRCWPQKSRWRRWREPKIEYPSRLHRSVAKATADLEKLT